METIAESNLFKFVYVTHKIHITLCADLYQMTAFKNSNDQELNTDVRFPVCT